MPPRLPIPKLTLFTGGKECSLCEVGLSEAKAEVKESDNQVAKQELAILRKSTAFDLVYWNIRDPPSGADEWEAKKWRRLYQYDIVSLAVRKQNQASAKFQPVLHLDDKRVQKHRINRPELQKVLEEWQASHGQLSQQ
jgi:hypothetical protein